MNRCISLEKIYKCSDQVIEDKICLIYLDAFQSKRGNEIEFNYVYEFDSMNIYKNENLIKTLYEKSNLFLDNTGILKGYESIRLIFILKAIVLIILIQSQSQMHSHLITMA